MTSIPAWLWHTLGWCVVALGAWMLVTGRRRLRPAPGRLCRRCGYDMAGLDARTCPECGRVAASERELLRRRGLWRWRIAGLTMIAAGWLVTVTPAVLRHGWAGGVPDWLLARVTQAQPAANVRTPSIWLFPIYDPRRVQVQLPATPAPGTTAFDTWLARRRQDLHNELTRRFFDGEMSDGPARTFLHRAMPLDEATAAKQIPFPKEWPSDAPSTSRQRGSVVAVLTVENRGNVDRLRVDLNVLCGPRTYTAATYFPAVDLTRPGSTFMRALSGPEIDQSVVEMLGPRLCTGSGDAWIELEGRVNPALDAPAPFLVADVRLLLDGKPVATGRIGVKRSHIAGAGATFPPMAWVPGGKAAVNARPRDVEMELTGRPEAALKYFLETWDNGLNAWGGSIRFKPPHDSRDNNATKAR